MSAARPSAKKLISSGLVVAAALVALFLFDVSRKQAAVNAAQSGAEAAAVPVVVHPISNQIVQQTIDAVGTVTADQQVLIASEVAGRVTQIHFDSGATVKAGTALVQLNDASLRKELDRHRATAELARVNLERAKRLHGQSMSRAQYEQHVAAYAESEAQVAQTEAEIALRSVRAPFTGVLGVRRVNLGQYVEAGVPIVSLTDMSKVHVDFTIPDRYRSQVAPGLEVSLSDDAAKPAVAAGKVTSVDPQIDAAHRAVSVRATLHDRYRQQWLPGAYVHVQVRLPSDRTALHVPAVALNTSLSGQSVFVIRKDGDRGIAQQVSVRELAETSTGDVAIESDSLRAGDLVVVAGQINLRDNSPVTLRMIDAGTSAAARSATDAGKE